MSNDQRKIQIMRDIILKKDDEIGWQEAILGWLRYEALRKLSQKEQDDLNYRNYKGENFNDMIDDIIIKNHAS